MVFLHPETLKVATTEDKASEVGVDSLEKILGRGKTQVCTGDISISSVAIDAHLRSISIAKHIERTETYIIVKNASAGTSKCFDGEDFTLLHLVRPVVLDERDLFATMNIILKDIMPGNIPDGFHRVGLSGDFDLVAFHDFLDRRADFTHSGVNASMLLKLAMYLEYRTWKENVP